LSRGPGRLQNRILLTLEPAWVSLNELAWRLQANKEQSAQITKAVWSLQRHGLVELEQRKLADFDEVVRVFPFKTHNKEVMKLRKELLPVLAAYRPPHVRYPQSKNEVHLLRQRSDLGVLAPRWTDLELRLLEVMSVARREHDFVLPVVWRARELLHVDHHVRDSRSLRALVRDAYEHGGSDLRAVLREVQSFCDELFPATAAIELKSLLHDMIIMTKSGASNLREEVVTFLLQRKGDVLRALPHHKDAPRRGRGPGLMSLRDALERTKLDPLVEELLTRKALERFKFLRLTEAGVTRRAEIEAKQARPTDGAR
jgi:hypothetical protein